MASRLAAACCPVNMGQRIMAGTEFGHADDGAGEQGRWRKAVSS